MRDCNVQDGNMERLPLEYASQSGEHAIGSGSIPSRKNPFLTACKCSLYWGGCGLRVSGDVVGREILLDVVQPDDRARSKRKLTPTGERGPFIMTKNGDCNWPRARRMALEQFDYPSPKSRALLTFAGLPNETNLSSSKFQKAV
jgi:hypothetical protein